MKKILFVILGLFVLSFQTFSKEQILINVGNEIFTKDMPDNYDEACETIRLLAGMYNDANEELNKLTLLINNSSSNNLDKLKEVENELSFVKSDLENVKSTNEQLEKKCKDLMSINNRLNMGFEFGPVFNFKDSIVGTHVGFIGIFRLIKNVHIGSSIFLDTYSITTNFDIGASFIVSFGIY